MPPGRSWGWKHNGGDRRRNQRYQEPNRGSFGNGPSRQCPYRWRSSNVTPWQTGPPQMNVCYVADPVTNTRSFFTANGINRLENRNFNEDRRDFSSSSSLRKRENSNFELPQFSKRKQPMNFSSNDRDIPQRIWNQENDSVYNESWNNNIRLSRSKSVPRSLESDAPIRRRCKTPGPSFSRDEGRNSFSRVSHNNNFYNRNSSSNTDQIGDTTFKTERSSTNIEEQKKQELRSRKWTEKTDKLATMLWGSSPDRNSDTNNDDSEVIDSPHTLQLHPDENLNDENPSSPSIEIPPYDSSKPIGTDGISKRVIFRCSYCYSLSLNKDAADKHVLSEIHYKNYINFKYYNVKRPIPLNNHSPSFEVEPNIDFDINQKEETSTSKGSEEFTPEQS